MWVYLYKWKFVLSKETTPVFRTTHVGYFSCLFYSVEIIQTLVIYSFYCVCPNHNRLMAIVLSFIGFYYTWHCSFTSHYLAAASEGLKSVWLSVDLWLTGSRLSYGSQSHYTMAPNVIVCQVNVIRSSYWTLLPDFFICDA